MKKAQAMTHLMMEFVIAVVILSIAFIFVAILAAGIDSNRPALLDFGRPEAELDVKLEAVTTSRVCNHDLTNFLRATDGESGLEFGQLLSLDANKFKTRAEEYFTNNFKRGNIINDGWILVASTQDLKPIASIGTLDEIPIRTSCTQFVPGLTPGEYYVVKLGTEY